MQIDIFTLEYLRYILSSIPTFLGFLLILLVINGDIKKIIQAAKRFFSRIREMYKRKIIAMEKAANSKKLQ